MWPDLQSNSCTQLVLTSSWTSEWEHFSVCCIRNIPICCVNSPNFPANMVENFTKTLLLSMHTNVESRKKKSQCEDIHYLILALILTCYLWYLSKSVQFFEPQHHKEKVKWLCFWQLSTKENAKKVYNNKIVNGCTHISKQSTLLQHQRHPQREDPDVPKRKWEIPLKFQLLSVHWKAGSTN